MMMTASNYDNINESSIMEITLSRQQDDFWLKGKEPDFTTLFCKARDWEELVFKMM